MRCLNRPSFHGPSSSVRGPWGECLGFWKNEDEKRDGTRVHEGWYEEFERLPLHPQPSHWAPVKDVIYDPPPPPKGPDAHVTVKMPDGKRLKVSLWQRER